MCFCLKLLCIRTCSQHLKTCVHIRLREKQNKTKHQPPSLRNRFCSASSLTLVLPSAVTTSFHLFSDKHSPEICDNHFLDFIIDNLCFRTLCKRTIVSLYYFVTGVLCSVWSLWYLRTGAFNGSSSICSPVFHCTNKAKFIIQF